MSSFVVGRLISQSTRRSLAYQTTGGAAALASPSDPTNPKDVQDQQVAQSFHGQHSSAATSLPWRDEFWRRVSVYKDVSARCFLSYQWSVSLPQK